MTTPTSLTPAARRAWLERQTLKRDAFLELCMNGNIACMNRILRVILDKPDLEAVEVTVQKSLPNKEGGREAGGGHGPFPSAARPGLREPGRDVFRRTCRHCSVLQKHRERRRTRGRVFEKTSG